MKAPPLGTLAITHLSQVSLGNEWTEHQKAVRIGIISDLAHTKLKPLDIKQADVNVGAALLTDLSLIVPPNLPGANESSIANIVSSTEANDWQKLTERTYRDFQGLASAAKAQASSLSILDIHLLADPVLRRAGQQEISVLLHKVAEDRSLNARICFYNQAMARSIGRKVFQHGATVLKSSQEMDFVATTNRCGFKFCKRCLYNSSNSGNWSLTLASLKMFSRPTKTPTHLDSLIGYATVLGGNRARGCLACA